MPRATDAPLLYGSTRPVVGAGASTSSIARALLAPTLFALVVRGLLLVLLPPAPVWDGVIYERAAEDIAAGRGLTRAIFSRDQPSDPTAFFPVGFPAALAPLRAAGAGRTGDLVFQCVVGVSLVPVGYALGRRLRGPAVGELAAWLVALWPGGALLSSSWMTEPLFSLLVGIGCAVAAWSSHKSRIRALVIAASLLSLAAYVRPTAFIILGALVVALSWIDRRRPRPLLRGALSLGLAVLVASVIHAPWAARNLAVIGAPVVVSTNGGFNLLLGTTGDGRFGDLPADIDCSSELGEAAKDRCRWGRAVARMGDRPGHALARSALKIVHTFGHESTPSQMWSESLDVNDEERETARLVALSVSEPFWLALLAAAFTGAALLWQRRRTGAVGAALLAPLAGTVLLHAVYLGGDRYHAPVVAPMAALAAFAIVELRRKRAGR